MKVGLTCYWDIKKEVCQKKPSSATCKDYDQYVFDENTSSVYDDDLELNIAGRRVARKRCKLLGSSYKGCKWNGLVKMCMAGDEEVDCTSIPNNPNKCKKAAGCQVTGVSGCKKFEDVSCADYRTRKSPLECYKKSNGGQIQKGKGCRILLGRCIDA